MDDSAPSPPPPQHQIGLTIDPSKVLNILSDVGHNNVRMELGGERGDFINEIYMSHSQMLGKFEYGGGPIFKVVLEC